MLFDKFGAEYTYYKKYVPAFFPVLSPFKGGQKWGLSVKRYFASQEYKLFIWVIILIIAFHFKEEFLIEAEGIDAKNIFMIIMVLFLALTDLAMELFVKKRFNLIGVL